MKHVDVSAMVNRGRKAGLTASEIYGALNAHVVGEAQQHGRADTNGYVSQYGEQGQYAHRRLDEQVVERRGAI